MFAIDRLNMNETGRPGPGQNRSKDAAASFLFAAAIASVTLRPCSTLTRKLSSDCRLGLHFLAAEAACANKSNTT